MTCWLRIAPPGALKFRIDGVAPVCTCKAPAPFSVPPDQFIVVAGDAGNNLMRLLFVSVPALCEMVAPAKFIVPVFVNVPPAIVRGCVNEGPVLYMPLLDAVPLFSTIAYCMLLKPEPLFKTSVPPLMVTVLPPEPMRLDASICSRPVEGIFTLAVVQNMSRMTPLGRIVSTFTDEVQICAVSPTIEPGTCPQLQFVACFQLRPAPAVRLQTAASAVGAPA